MEKKQYTQPLCTVNGLLPQMMVATSPNTMKVNNGNAVYDIGGDVNRNEDYDIWDNWDIIP